MTGWRLAIRSSTAAAGWLVATATLLAQAPRESLPIDMQVAIEPGAPGHLVPQWAKLLADVGVPNARLRSATPSDRPSVEAIDSRGAKRYRVVALLNRRNQIELPGGRFSQADRARLKKFLLELPARTDDTGVERGRFDLTQPEFERVFLDLSKINKASTQGVKPMSAASQLAAQLSTPIAFDPGVADVLRAAKPLTQQWRGAALGTALAGVLREAGLAIVPEQPRGKPLQLRVAPLGQLEEWWPVGWKPEASGRKVAPQMHQSKEIEIAGYSLDAALQALEGPLGVPIYFDQLIVDRRKLDLSATQVKLPRSRSMIRRAVDRILSQGRLAGELRVDEAGRPFYWVTQYGKDSPRATN